MIYAVTVMEGQLILQNLLAAPSLFIFSYQVGGKSLFGIYISIGIHISIGISQSWYTILKIGFFQPNNENLANVSIWDQNE